MKHLPHCAKETKKIKRGGGETSLKEVKGLGMLDLPTITLVEPASYIMIV